MLHNQNSDQMISRCPCASTYVFIAACTYTEKLLNKIYIISISANGWSKLMEQTDGAGECQKCDKNIKVHIPKTSKLENEGGANYRG